MTEVDCVLLLHSVLVFSRLRLFGSWNCLGKRDTVLVISNVRGCGDVAFGDDILDTLAELLCSFVFLYSSAEYANIFTDAWYQAWSISVLVKKPKPPIIVVWYNTTLTTQIPVIPYPIPKLFDSKGCCATRSTYWRRRI